MARKAIAFAGIGALGSAEPDRGPQGKQGRRVGDRARTSSDGGRSQPVEVDGWLGRAVRCYTADCRPPLTTSRAVACRARGSRADTTTADEVRAAVAARTRHRTQARESALRLRYIWEIYKKPELVVYGRYVMPILWGDALVGRADLRTDRTGENSGRQRRLARRRRDSPRRRLPRRARSGRASARRVFSMWSASTRPRS